jgi:hypothetical protein
MIKLTDILSEILSEKKLCPKGRAYYNRRISAGEKPSAYLSGRAVKVCKGLMKEFLNEEIDPSEAYNDTDAIDTLVKRKRDLAFIVQGANTDNNWAKIQKTIKDNDIRIMYVKGNPHHAYIAYLPGSENKATKLKDLAEKYEGYLSAQATKEDTIQMGRLLGYKEDKIKEYVNKNFPNDPIDESLEDTSWIGEKGQKITLPQLLNAIKDYPVIQAPIEKVEKIVIKKDSGGIESNRLGAADTKYPIIIVVDDSENFKYILDGNHRANKAIDAGLKSIPAKLVNIKKLSQEFQDVLSESLRDWFKKEDWVRIDTQGNITGPCGTMKKGKATTRCLPRAKANSLTKDERAATARKKVAGSKKGKQFVSNTKKAKVKLRK